MAWSRRAAAWERSQRMQHKARDLLEAFPTGLVPTTTLAPLRSPGFKPVRHHSRLLNRNLNYAREARARVPAGLPACLGRLKVLD